MARRPAPVQITWIGYPNSTGLEAIDYRLTDDTCDPVSTHQTFVEELVRLPGCFLCYTPPRDAPPVAPLPAAGRGFVTFGSFNALAKVTDAVLALWAAVLARVPGSRLVLKNKPFACGQARALWTARLAALGIEAWRVDLLPLAASNAEHLAQYALVDVSLDPFPYAGTTTTAETLFMGVPCISMRGGCHAHNVGASLLGAVGLAADWVVDDEEAYVRRAVAAASDLPRLAALRAGMRQRVLDSPLCDGVAFVRGLEGVYGRLFERWLAGGAAEAAAAAAAAAVDGAIGSHVSAAAGGDTPPAVDAQSGGPPAQAPPGSVESDRGDDSGDDDVSGGGDGGNCGGRGDMGCFGSRFVSSGGSGDSSGSEQDLDQDQDDRSQQPSDDTRQKPRTAGKQQQEQLGHLRRQGVKRRSE
jgi:protein O-GlcNAc transferase